MKTIISTLLLSLFLHSCVTFKPVSKDYNDNSKLLGLFSNDFDSVNRRYVTPPCLWRYVDNKYKGLDTGLSVRIEINPNNKLQATLLNKDEKIDTRVLKGKFREDKCYYLPKRFLFVPILPILWFYDNEQKRIYATDDYLILNNVYNQGGAFIIWAGGSKGDLEFFFKKIKN